MELTQKIYIDDVITNLEDREQSILKLYYYAGFSEEEIADSYQISQQRVNQIKSRALQKCKKLINKTPPCAIIA